MSWLFYAWDWLVNVPSNWAVWYWAIFGFMLSNFIVWLCLPKDEHAHTQEEMSWHEFSSLLLSLGCNDDIVIADDYRARNERYVAFYIFFLFISFLGMFGAILTGQDQGSIAILWPGFSNWIFLKMILQGMLTYASVWAGYFGLKGLQRLARKIIEGAIAGKNWLYAEIKATKEEEARLRAEVEAKQRRDPANIKKFCKDKVDEAHKILIKGLADTGAFLQGTGAILNLLDELLELLTALNTSLPENVQNNFSADSVKRADTLFNDAPLEKYADSMLKMLNEECSNAREVRHRTQALVEAIVVLCDHLPLIAVNAQAGMRVKSLESIINDLRALSNLVEDRGSEALKQIETGEFLEEKLKSIFTATQQVTEPVQSKTAMKN